MKFYVIPLVTPAPTPVAPKLENPVLRPVLTNYVAGARVVVVIGARFVVIGARVVVGATYVVGAT